MILAVLLLVTTIGGAARPQQSPASKYPTAIEQHWFPHDASVPVGVNGEIVQALLVAEAALQSRTDLNSDGKQIANYTVAYAEAPHVIYIMVLPTRRPPSAPPIRAIGDGDKYGRQLLYTIDRKDYRVLKVGVYL